MARKKELKEIEDKLYNYFAKDRKIASLKYKIEVLEQQIENIKREKIDCTKWYAGISWGDKVQTSPTGTSFAETEIIKLEERKEQRISECLQEIEDIKETIDKIQKENSIIDYNIKFLGEEEKQILNYKYKYKWNEFKIARELFKDQSVINKKRRKILYDIVRWEEWF